MSAASIAVPAGWIVPQVVSHRGSRGSALVDFQLLCGAGEYELDVLVRECTDPARFEIVGQVTRAGHIYAPVADLRLTLVRPDSARRLLDTCTDQFGEFNLSAPCKDTYGLRLGDAPDAPCVLVAEGGGEPWAA